MQWLLSFIAQNPKHYQKVMDAVSEFVFVL